MFFSQNSGSFFQPTKFDCYTVKGWLAGDQLIEDGGFAAGLAEKGILAGCGGWNSIAAKR